jgi:ribosome-associated translation inhibitor RaiA
MTSLEASRHTGSKHSSLVHITIRSLEDTEALELYIHDRINRQASKGREVLWYEVIVRGTTHRHRRGPYAAQITAHLPHKDVFVSQLSDDIYLVARDAIDELSQRLSRMF